MVGYESRAAFVGFNRTSEASKGGIIENDRHLLELIQSHL